MVKSILFPMFLPFLLPQTALSTKTLSSASQMKFNSLRLVVFTVFKSWWRTFTRRLILSSSMLTSKMQKNETSSFKQLKISLASSPRLTGHCTGYLTKNQRSQNVSLPLPQWKAFSFRALSPPSFGWRNEVLCLVWPSQTSWSAATKASIPILLACFSPIWSVDHTPKQYSKS